MKLLRELNIDTNNVVLTETKEANFGQKLKWFLNELEISYIHQFSIKEYLIDFYLPDYKLAIEFDEEHHKYNEQADIKRQKKIEKWLNCSFVRIDENEPYEVALAKITKRLLSNI